MFSFVCLTVMLGDAACGTRLMPAWKALIPRLTDNHSTLCNSNKGSFHVTCTMSGRDAQYAGEASYGSAPPGFVYQPNGYKSPQEQPRQPYNQNQNSAYYNHYNAPPEPPRQRDPPPRPRDDRYDYYDLRESYQNRGWGNNRNYYEPPRDPGYYPRAYTLDRRTEGRTTLPIATRTGVSLIVS